MGTYSVLTMYAKATQRLVGSQGYTCLKTPPSVGGREARGHSYTKRVYYNGKAVYNRAGMATYPHLCESKGLGLGYHKPSVCITAFP